MSASVHVDTDPLAGNGCVESGLLLPFESVPRSPSSLIIQGEGGKQAKEGEESGEERRREEGRGEESTKEGGKTAAAAKGGRKEGRKGEGKKEGSGRRREEELKKGGRREEGGGEREREREAGTGEKGKLFLQFPTVCVFLQDSISLNASQVCKVL